MTPQKAGWQLTDVRVGGVDVRSDSVAVQPPKCLVAENVTLNTPGRGRKRIGTKRRASAALVRIIGNAVPRTISISEARWVSTEQSGRILAHMDNLLLSESGGLLLARGYLDQMRITAGRLNQSSFADPGAFVNPTSDCAVAGDVLVVTGNDTGGSPQIALLDLASGAEIQPVIRWGFGTLHRAVSLGASALVFTSDTSGHIFCFPVVGAQVRQMSPISGVFGNYALQATLYNTVISDSATAPLWDVTVVNGRAVLAYMNNAGNIARCYIGANGKLDGAIQTEVPGNTVVALAVQYGDTNGRLLIAWGSDAGSILKARDYNSDATLTANAAITTIDTATGYKQIALAVRGTNWTLLYETGNTQLHKRLINRADWTTSGSPVVYTYQLGLGASLGSKIWTDATTGKRYCVVAYESQTQPSVQVTFFVYSIAGIDPGTNPGVFEEEYFVLVGILWPGFAGGVLPVPFLPNVTVIGRTARLALLYRSEQTETLKVTNVRPVTIVHAPTDMQPGVQGPDGASYAPGGMLWRIDEGLGSGNSVVASWIVSEAGFALSPDNVVLTPLGGGNLQPGATYGYRAYYRDWATGERSTTFAFTGTLGGAQGSFSLAVPSLPHTNRRTVVIDVFRTVANPVPGAPYYYVSSIYSSERVGAGLITDALADATLITRRRDYLTLGEVDEDAPPACEFVAMGQGRAALVGVDDDGTIWITKQRGVGEPLRWSALLLAVADSPTPGRPRALAWNGPDLVVWRTRSIQVLSGRGPDNTGAGGTIEPKQIISDQIGCLTPRSLVRIPAGWVFQAADGTYWQLGIDGSLTYVGADVEPLGDVCLGSFVVHSRKQAIFVSAARVLVYHYDSGVWTTQTRSAIAAAALPDGTGVYLPSAASSAVLQDDPAGYRDDGVEYVQRVRLPWFRPQGVDGEIHIRRLLINGGYDGPHHPLVRLYYDYEPGFNETLEWQADTVVGTITQGDGTSVFGGPSRLNLATQVYNYAVPLARERCMALGVEIIDRAIAGGAGLGASFWITSIGFEWAPIGAVGASGYRLEQSRLAQ